VLYLTGDSGTEAAGVRELSTYAQRHDWHVAFVCSDPDSAELAWFRKGLQSALALVSAHDADGVVVEQAMFDELSRDDQRWLRGRLARFGGFLEVARQDPGTNAPLTTRDGQRHGFVWQLRYTWEPAAGITHPRFTYAAVESEERARTVALEAIARMTGKADLRLVEVHWRHIASKDWTRAE
jgi:hypothetical protein